MKKIENIDKNFLIDTKINKPDICFYDVKENSFCLFGLHYEEGFRRMPQNIAKTVNDGVFELHTNTAGGRIRFITNSPYIAISVKMANVTKSSHMPQTGSSGFDLYVDGIFKNMFVPPLDIDGGYESLAELGTGKRRNITINFPLYNDVEELYIGLAKDAVFEPMQPYSTDGKVVFYGSSITQGGCVSRPGNSYPAHISRMLDCDYINLGFSGSAKGEEVMAEYIAKLNPLVFVLDYDHNASDAVYLKDTHEKFFKKFREHQKHTPLVIVSAPDIRFRYDEWSKRREIIKRTYANAIEAEDKNVYFVDGETLWSEEGWDACTVDGCHPNDMGHFRMATKIAPVIKKAIDNARRMKK